MRIKLAPTTLVPAQLVPAELTIALSKVKPPLIPTLREGGMETEEGGGVCIKSVLINRVSVLSGLNLEKM